MYPDTPSFSISQSTIFDDTLLAATLGNSLSPPSPYSSGSSSSSLSPAYSPLSLSPISPVSPGSSLFDSEGEDFHMDRLSDIKNQLNMFPPPMTAMQFIEKNAFQNVDGHIKRPSNNFILFRKIAHDQKNQTQTLAHYNEREWSQIIGKIWKSLSSEEVTTYKKLGEEVAKIHKRLFPNYKYQPKRDKAAWKHYTVPTAPSNKKSKTKGKDKKQQKQQTQERQALEIITDFQQQPLIHSNAMSFNLPNNLPNIPTVSATDLSTDGFSFEYQADYDNNFTSNNFSSNNFTNNFTNIANNNLFTDELSWINI